MRLSRHLAGLAAGLAGALLALAFDAPHYADAQGYAASRPGTVYRGVLTGGIWVELAEDGSGRAELVVLDGLPGGAPEPRFFGLQASYPQGRCVLRGADTGVQIDGCPSGGTFKAGVTLGQLTGQALLQPVGWEGSFAWLADTGEVGNVRRTCALTGLARAPGLNGTPFLPAISALAADATVMPVMTGSLSQSLSKLRADRLRAYSSIALTPAEAARAREVEEAVAGRPVYGRTVPLAEATRDRMAFDQQVANTPQRVQARQELLQIDRALAEVYDPTASLRRTAALSRMRSQGVANARRALDETLLARQPASIVDLITLEGLVAELDGCVASLGVAGAANARAQVRSALTSRASEIVEIMHLAMANKSSADARAALAVFENSSAVREALRDGGQADALAAAQSRVRQIAQSEERERQEAERAARAAAARDAIPPTTGVGAFQASRVSRAVVDITNVEGRGGGSGFIVAPGIVVTNVHVVEGGRTFQVVVNGGTRKDAKTGRVIAQYPIHDIAILRVEGLAGQTVSIASREPAQGQGVWAMGFPGLADSFKTDDVTSATLTMGIVSRIYGGRTIQGQGAGETRLVQHTAEIAPGNSGGPLFDACHRVVGVNTQTVARNASQFLVAVSATFLPELLRQAGVTPSVSAGRCGG